MSADVPQDPLDRTESVAESLSPAGDLDIADQEKEYRFSFGSLPDIIYVGHKDQKDWSGLTLSDFYIIIQDRVALNFRMSKKAPFSLFPADVVDFLKTFPEVNDFSFPVLIFKDMEVPADTNLVNFLLTKPTFILAESGSAVDHSGRLFTCGGVHCRDSDGHPMGWTKLSNYKAHAKKRRNKPGACCLLDEDLLMVPTGKRGWGNLADYLGGNPHGCPTDMKLSQFQSAEVDLPDLVVEDPLEPAIEVVPAPTDHQQRVTRQTIRERKKRERKKSKQSEKEVPLPSLIETAGIAENSSQRRITMAVQLDSPPTETSFEPDVQDLDFENRFIKAPCMTGSKKFQRARADLTELRPESLEAMQKGQLPDYKMDSDYVAETYKSTLRGAHLLMTVLGKDLGRERIHYRDFLAFGTNELIWPRNVVSLLDTQLKSGNDKGSALTAYKLILRTQSEESRKAELSFSSYIPDKDREDLSPVQLQHKCMKEAEVFRTSVTNVLSEMVKQGASTGFRAQQKVQQDRNKELQTRLQGPLVPDASTVLPKYFSNDWVLSQEAELLACARDSSRIPFRKQMKSFTNLLMVRLMLKGTHRKEIMTKLQRKNYLEAKSEGLRVGNFSPVEATDTEDDDDNDDDDDDDTAAGGAAVEGLKSRDLVLVLGDTADGDGGQFRLNLGPVDHSGAKLNKGRKSQKQKEEQDGLRAATEGICISRNLHKTFYKGDAFLWLSLPDVVLMDSYEVIAIRYCKEHHYSYGMEDRFFFTPQGKEVTDIDFGAFSRISGRDRDVPKWFSPIQSFCCRFLQIHRPYGSESVYRLCETSGRPEAD